MITKTVWTEKMKFRGEAGVDNKEFVMMDAKSPIGEGKGLTPKELVAIGVAGCSAMDVVALLKKHKQVLEAFEVETDVTSTEGVHPAVFKNIKLTYSLKGPLDKERVLESVKLSQTRYCGVSAMISKSVPIAYNVLLNGEEIGSGIAEF